MYVSRYTRYSDPAHGWLAVPMAELHRLGIADDISGFSARDGDTAYLEEDCDMGIFLAAKSRLGEAVAIDEIYQGASSVRTYPGYHLG